MCTYVTREGRDRGQRQGRGRLVRADPRHRLRRPPGPRALRAHPQHRLPGAGARPVGARRRRADRGGGARAGRGDHAGVGRGTARVRVAGPVTGETGVPGGRNHGNARLAPGLLLAEDGLRGVLDLLACLLDRARRLVGTALGLELGVVGGLAPRLPWPCPSTLRPCFRSCHRGPWPHSLSRTDIHGVPRFARRQPSPGRRRSCAGRGSDTPSDRPPVAATRVLGAGAMVVSGSIRVLCSQGPAVCGPAMRLPSGAGMSCRTPLERTDGGRRHVRDRG